MGRAGEGERRGGGLNERRTTDAIGVDASVPAGHT